MAKCGQCKKLFTYREGHTSNLRQHLQGQHGMGYEFSEKQYCTLSKESLGVVTKNEKYRGYKYDTTNEILQTSMIENQSSESENEAVLENIGTASKPKVEMCTICNKLFSNTSNRNRHLKLQHGILFSQTSGVGDDVGNNEECEEIHPSLQEEELISDFDWEEAPENTGNKKSGAWKYFIEINENTLKCNICDATVSNRGRVTHALKRHLKFKHDLNLTVDKVPQKRLQQESSDSEQQEVKKNKRKMSVTWKYFVKTRHNWAMCTTCKRELSVIGGTTGNIRRHLRDVHGIELGGSKVDTVDMTKLDDEYASDDNATLENTGTRKSSEVWEHFTLVDNSAQCDHCSERLKLHGSSIGNLIRHLRMKHAEENSSDED